VTREPTADVSDANGNDGDDNGFGSFFQRNWDSQPTTARRRGGQYYYRPVQRGWW
jgi:hypothetical protein